MDNTIFFKKTGKLLLPNAKNGGTSTQEYVLTIVKNIEPLGYLLSEDAINKLTEYSNNDLDNWYNEILPILKKSKGAHVRHNPMYKNFPQEVMDMSYAHLYLNAILHYISVSIKRETGLDTTYMPRSIKKERPVLNENIKYDIIDVATTMDYLKVFGEIISSNGSISEQDKEYVSKTISDYGSKLYPYIPKNIPYKENLVYLFTELHGRGMDTSFIVFTTLNDILRLAVGLSGGDVSLGTLTFFKRFKRVDRRLILSYIDQFRWNDNIDDILKYRERWKVLFHGLHVGEYKYKYPNAFIVADIARGNFKVVSFNSAVEAAFNSMKKMDGYRSYESLLYLLRQRPSEYTRNLDRMGRTFKDTEVITDTFSEIIDMVSTNVLLQTKDHFEERLEKVKFRTFFIKGNTAKVYVKPNDLPEISIDFCRNIITLIDNELKNRFSQLDDMGKVYINPILNDIVVPFSERSASSSHKTVSRLSSFDFDSDKNFIRMFIHWADPEDGYVDLDLSGAVLNENFENIDVIYFRSLKSNKINAYHSGDITSGGYGASEFIDFDIQNAIDAGGRYIYQEVNSYSHHPFSEIPNCFAGWMFRDNINDGAIFEPKTVAQKYDLTSVKKVSCPVIFDLVERKAIWLDINIRKLKNTSNTIVNNQKNSLMVLQGLLSRKRITVAELLTLHVESRNGIIVNNKEEADTVYDENFKYEGSKILSEYIL